jgi:hypothetical protein
VCLSLSFARREVRGQPILESRRVVSSPAAQRASPRCRRASCHEHSRNVSGIAIYAALSITHNEHSQWRLRVRGDIAPYGVVNDAPCSPLTRHGASIRYACGARQRGPGNYESVGKTQSVRVMSHPMISPRNPVPLVATGSVDGKLTIAPTAADGVVAAGGRPLPAAPSLTAAAHLLTQATRPQILMKP